MPVHPLLAKMQEYAPTAFWAVWPPATTYDRVTDISFPTTGLEALHAKSVILGLNRGGAGHALKPWQNFHTGPKHNDYFLAEAFRDTPHWGCYMTDLLAEVNSDSKTLNMSASQLRDDVSDLIAELRLLGVSDPMFILPS